MIRYALQCDKAHGFEAWFRNSQDCETQLGRGLVSCPLCGSRAVEKTLMAPAVATAGRRAETEVPAREAAALIAEDARHADLVARLKDLRAQILTEADYVGTAFAEEARKIHYGEADRRSIYGETPLDEARALAEEGIGILPLPVLPEDRN
ncbi:DUF1178 family protein [Polymorphum gilvum]|uniref:Hypothetical conserved protein n=1 Tax=Polymorphum gilvum (strain LMG 25793 / CGMCC 1.9160 / SL003B-26A1) TaxID=991905 RepID=F2J333_POLGS|nr:DUF1178 family protein [Polymorphum gilvum]ADZ68903.1 Hypothetical conserved protein [Polymorphum gilvum SL003B-26A1]